MNKLYSTGIVVYGMFVAAASAAGGGRPSTAPTFGALSAASPHCPREDQKTVVADDDDDELMAVRFPLSDGGATLFSDGTPIPEIPHRTYSPVALPEVARAPAPADSRDRFLDDSVVPCAVPRTRGSVVSASAHFEEIHKLFHDLLMAFFYGDSDKIEDQGKARELKEARQETRWQERRARRNNPKYAFLLERLLPLVAQGLTELGHAIMHRQLSLERVLPQSILLTKGTDAATATTSSSVSLSPGAGRAAVAPGWRWRTARASRYSKSITSSRHGGGFVGCVKISVPRTRETPVAAAFGPSASAANMLKLR